MSNSADVRSLEQLESLLQHFQFTRTELSRELDNLQLELQRLSIWIERDIVKYWQGELLQSQRNFVECQQALLRKRSVVRESERQPCSEEVKRLDVAKRRREECELQLRISQEAGRAWEREKAKLSTHLQRNRDLCDSELALGIFELRDQLQRLESYTNLRSEALRSSTSSTANPPTDPVNNQQVQDNLNTQSNNLPAGEKL